MVLKPNCSLQRPGNIVVRFQYPRSQHLHSVSNLSRFFPASEDYDYDSFDSDGDNASNILERQSDTSPLDSGEVPDFINVDVFAELPAELVTAGFSDYQIVATVGTGTVSTDATAGEFLSQQMRLPVSSDRSLLRCGRRQCGRWV